MSALEWKITKSGWVTRGAAITYAPKHRLGRYLWVVPSASEMGVCQSLEAAMVAAQAAMEARP
jgi:hypothetical protein